MKITFELTELKGIGLLHQPGFEMRAGGEPVVNFCTVLPSGLPLIFVKLGPHAGKIFTVRADDAMTALDEAFFHEPAAEPAPAA